MARLLSPLRLTGIVTQGFGRGGKELGCPTANMDKKAVDTAKNLSTGGYGVTTSELFCCFYFCLLFYNLCMFDVILADSSEFMFSPPFLTVCILKMY